MTTLFEDDSDADGLEDQIYPMVDAAARSERAAILLDEIGLISGSARVTSAAILFVEDMQRRLRAARDRKIEFACSEKQLEWLEAIYERVC